MHVEDIQAELKELSTLLNTSFDAPTTAQKNLIIELVVMKMQHLSGDWHEESTTNSNG